MGDFRETEAKGKIGKRVCVTVDGAFGRDDIKKGMTGKVINAEPSHYTRGDDPSNDVWSVSVEFDDKSIDIVHNIHKWEYEDGLKEI